MRLTRRGVRGRARAALALAAAVVSAGLVLTAAPPADPATSGTAVNVALDEWNLVPAQASVRPGRISFIVRNDGTLAHEFVVLRSDRHHHSLKTTAGRALETGRLGEIPTIPSGTSKRLTLTMPPGKYILLCNLLGHYQAGQYAALRVR